MDTDNLTTFFLIAVLILVPVAIFVGTSPVYINERDLGKLAYYCASGEVLGGAIEGRISTTHYLTIALDNGDEVSLPIHAKDAFTVEKGDLVYVVLNKDKEAMALLHPLDATQINLEKIEM